MPNAAAHQAIVVGGLNPVEGKVFAVPTHPAVDEKEVITSDAARTASTATLEGKIRPSSSPDDDTDDHYEDEEGNDNVIIVTGGDAARHLLPMRDDHDPALTFRSIFLASGLSCFQAVLSQIYTVSQHLGITYPVGPFKLRGSSIRTVNFSSNQPRLPSQGLLSSSSHTLPVKPGPLDSPVETSMRLNGGRRAARGNLPCGSRSSASSTLGRGL